MILKENGLKSEEAKDLLNQHGYNEIKSNIFVSPLSIFFRQIKNNAIIYLLLIAATISFFVGKLLTSYTVIAVIFLVVVIGFIQEYRAERVIKSLKGMIMPVSILIRDGKELEVLSREIVPGDIIILRSGEKVPADCIIIQHKDLEVNESILTGESREVRKSEQISGKDVSDDNLLFMGSFIVNGKCLAKTINTGMNTKFGKISGMIATAEKKLPLAEKINSIAKTMALVAIVFSSLTGLLMFTREPFTDQLLVEVLVLVIALSVSAFPESFPVVLITALSNGAYKMGKNNAIVNRMSIIETLGETTVICSDKTGTITKGEMTVKDIYIDGRDISLSGTGYVGAGDFLEDSSKINLEKDIVLSKFLQYSVLCNDSRIERTGEDEHYKALGTPTESALLIAAAKAKIYKEDMDFERIEEISFSSSRKLMSVFGKFNKKDIVVTKGALEYVLNKCTHIQRRNGVFKITKHERESILSKNLSMTKDALRTIALAYKETKSKTKDSLEKDLIFMGIAGIQDPPREEVKEAIKTCFMAGIAVKMITGDNKETAIAIGKEIGIVGKVMEGFELENITDEDLSKVVDKIAIFARVNPEHKIKIVRALKANGEIVAMTGDGVNDAPALKEAHIGIAMGKNGTDVSRSVADLTLKDDNFSSIVKAIKEGRTIFKNVRKFTSYQLSCSYAELTILFTAMLFSQVLGWQVPIIIAIQILFMNLVTTDLPAITLALVPASKDVMDEKPRKKQTILNKISIIWLIVASISLAAITLSVFYVDYNVLGNSTEYARTTTLLSLIFLEIISAYNFMSFRESVKPKSFFANKYLLVASVLSLALTALIIYSPLNKAFETVPLGVESWIIALVGSLLLIAVFNILKFMNNKFEFALNSD